MADQDVPVIRVRFSTYNAREFQFVQLICIRAAEMQEGKPFRKDLLRAIVEASCRTGMAVHWDDEPTPMANIVADIRNLLG